MVFTYAPGRSGQYADDILKGFAGVLQVPSHGLQANHCRATDGYAGYNRLIQPERAGPAIKLAYCWAHARRKLFEVARKSTAPIAEDGLRRIAEFYKIEAEIRGLSREARLAIRQGQSAPKIAELKAWLTHHRARVSAKSPLGEALKYIAKYWTGLCRFLVDGRVEMDSNAVEPHAYLTAALTAIVNRHKQSQIDDLLPWNYAPKV